MAAEQAIELNRVQGLSGEKRHLDGVKDALLVSPQGCSLDVAHARHQL